MLKAADHLRHLTIHATDGEIGRVTDCYFDDDTWTVRYLVVRTGHWLAGRDVLLTPPVIEAVRWADKELVVSLTRDEVRSSPDVSTEQPVSRLQEIDFLRHYDLPPYWILGSEMGDTSMALDAAMRAAAAEAEHAGERVQSHLRSTREVVGYVVEATDGAMGHVKDFVIDDTDWRVRALVVDTTTWWFGGEVLVAPRHVTRVSWGERQVHVDVPRETVRSAPAYTPGREISEVYLASLARHYDESR